MSKITVCTTCLGRGVIRIKHIIDKNKDNFYYKSEECPDCQGLGYSENKREKNGNKKRFVSSRSNDWRCNPY